MSRIEELNLTIPDALDIQEQQRVLIENFSLIKDLLLTPGYIHFHRHKETSDSLSTTPLEIYGYDHKTTSRKKLDIDISTGEISVEINGVYKFHWFMHVEGSASNVYWIDLYNKTTSTILNSYTFDAHDPGGHVYMVHEFIEEFDYTITDDDLVFRIYLDTGSNSVTVAFVHITIERLDNYQIPN